MVAIWQKEKDALMQGHSILYVLIPYVKKQLVELPNRVGRYTDDTVYRRYQPIPVWLICNTEIPFVLVIKYFCGLEVASKPLL